MQLIFPIYPSALMYMSVLFENICKWDFLPEGAQSVKAFICQIRNGEGGGIQHGLVVMDGRHMKQSLKEC